MLRDFQAPFCPIHKQQSPCLFCLYPEVLQLICDSHDEDQDDFIGILIQQVDTNVN